MIDASALPVSPSGPWYSPRVVLAAWRGITARRIGAAFLLGCALFAYRIPTGTALGEGAFGLAIVFVSDQIKMIPLLLAFTLADHVTGRDPERRGVYLLAAVAGAVAGAPFAVTWVQSIFKSFGRPTGSHLGFTIYLALDMVVLSCAVVWVILDRRRALRARERMHLAELDRIAAEKRSIESDLQAMQARIEPQFLFNTLAHVKRLYAQDPTLGERMLDELIAYLRAAMPKMRDTASTVGQEIELARAYLAILGVRLRDRLSFAFESSPEADAVRMPPMMLLPLLDHAVEREDDAAAARSMRIRAAIVDGRLRVEVADSGRAFVRDSGDGAVAAIRERLSALFGGSGRLLLSRRPDGGSEATLELPLEASPRSAAAGSALRPAPLPTGTLASRATTAP